MRQDNGVLDGEALRSRWMELPRRVVIESGAIEEISEICDDLNLKGRALIITGPNTINVMGKKIAELLERFQPKIMISQTSKLEEVDRAELLAREIQAGFIIGAGGGRAIDIAKLASLHR